MKTLNHGSNAETLLFIIITIVTLGTDVSGLAVAVTTEFMNECLPARLPEEEDV